MHTWSNDQLAVIDKVLGLEKGQKLLVEAKGGCGKSTVLAYCVYQLALAEPEAKFALVAPTHIARKELYAKVVQQFGDRIDLLANVYCYTSAAFSGRYLAEKLETGDLQNRRHAYAKAFAFDWRLVIVDEISLTPWSDMQAIYAETYACPVVMLGDRHQARAPKQGESPVFSDCKFRVSLETNHRAPSVLGQLADQARGKVFYPDQSTSMNKVHNSADELLEHFVQAVLAEEPANRHKHCFIAFTNERVAQADRALRLALYGNEQAEWQIGEKVRVLGGIPGLDAGQLVEITKIVGEKAFAFEDVCKLRVQLVQLFDGEQYYEAELLPADQQIVWSQTIAELQAKGDAASQAGDHESATNWWSLRSGLANSFGTVQSANCLTVLRSQSRTIEYVYADTKDIARFAANKAKVLYVAYSRASKFLHTVAIGSANKLSNAEAYERFNISAIIA